jgi:CRISPR-associated protein Cas2
MGWLLVAFDLPVVEPEQRKKATQFRKFLLDDGYIMIQYSVYARSMVSQARTQTHMRRLRKHIPEEGRVRAIYITQAQWDRSYIMYGEPMGKQDPEQIPKQLLFW